MIALKPELTVSCRGAGIRGVVTPVQPEEFVEVLEWDIGETEVAAKADHQRMELWIAPVTRCQREALVKLVPLISMKFEFWLPLNSPKERRVGHDQVDFLANLWK